jgi:uncharacterized membrane protein YhaH (DUF805 family)
MDQSGRWLLTVVIPVIGATTLFCILAFKPGSDEPNCWGRRSSADGDFLAVQ